MATLSLFRTCTRVSSRVTRNRYNTYAYARDGVRSRLVLKIQLFLQIRPSNFGKC